jgi:hypothetical protein
MLTIRSEQLQAFANASWGEFEDRQLEHAREYFPVDHRMLGGDEGTRQYIRQGIVRARASAVSVFGDACRYIDLMFALGLDFAIDPQLPWAKAALDDESQGVSTRVDLLHAAALSYLDRVAGEDGQHYLRTVMKARGLSYEEIAAGDEDFEASARAVFAKLWPRKYREIRGEPMGRFLPRASAMIERDGLSAPGARVVYATLMFLLGSAFATDPAYPWAAAIVRDEKLGANEKARALIESAKDHLERTLEAIRESGSG